MAESDTIVRQFGLTNKEVGQVALKFLWTSADMTACLPLALLEDLKLNPSQLMLNKVGPNTRPYDWRMFEQRAKVIRSLSGDIPLEVVRRGYFELPGLKTTPFPNLKHLDIGLKGAHADILSRFLVAGLRTLHLTFFDPFPEDKDMTALLSIATELTELADLSFDLRLSADSCRATFGFLGRKVGPPHVGGVLYDMRLRWLGSFLASLPKPASLVALSIGGCFVTDEICAVLPSMTGLRLVDFATWDVVLFPNYPMASLPDGLQSITADLEKLHVQAFSSAIPFDMSAITHFTNITQLDLHIGADAMPIHVGLLSTLHLLQSAAIRFWGMHAILDADVFHALVAGWPHMRRLLFAVPVKGYMRQLGYVLHIRDLVDLGIACPLLESFKVPVETRVKRPLPMTTHPLHHLTKLDLSSSPIRQEDVVDVLRYMKVLFPNVTTLLPGEPVYRWEPIQEEFQERRSATDGDI